MLQDFKSEVEQALDEQKRTCNELVDFMMIFSARDVAEELELAGISEFTVSQRDCLQSLYELTQYGAKIEGMTMITTLWNTQVPAVKLRLEGADNAEKEASAD